jgi:hypothetical protein
MVVIDVDSALGCPRCVDVGSVANVSELLYDFHLHGQSE